MDFEYISNLINENKFSEVEEYVVNEINNSKSLLNILIFVCKEVVRKSSHKTVIYDIYKLVRECSNRLILDKDEDIENFILSMYHIIKVMCNYAFYEEVISLMKYIEKYCVEMKYKTKSYNYYISLLYNTFIQKTTNIFNKDFLFDVIILSLKMSLLITDNNMVNFLRIQKTYIITFNNSCFDYEICNKFVTKILDLMTNLYKTTKNIHSQLIFECLLLVYQMCVSIIFKSTPETFDLCNIKKVFELMNLYCYDDYSDCIDMISLSSECLIKHIQNFKELDAKMLASCHELLRNKLKNKEKDTIVAMTAINIAKLLFCTFSYFQSVKEFWIVYLKDELKVQILKVANILSQYFAKCEIYLEKCCSKCQSYMYNINEAVKISKMSSVFVISNLKLEIPCSEQLHTITVQCLRDCCEFIKQLHLRKCEMWFNNWQIVGVNLYNISIILSKQKIYIYMKQYLKLFVQYIFKFEGVDNINAVRCFPKSLTTSLHLNALGCFYLNEFEESMVYLALCMLYCPTFRQKAFNTWILVKSGADEMIKIKTTYQILSNEEYIKKEIYSSYKYNSEECETLLMDELHFYFNKWQSKIPLLGVCKDICLLSKDIIKRTKCFWIIWPRVIYLSNQIYIQNVRSTIDLIQTSNCYNQTDHQMCLSVLYFILYLIEFTEIQRKNLNDMNETYIPPEVNQLSSDDSPPNSRCDVVPTYFNLKFDHLTEIFKLLDNILNIWTELLHSDIDFELIFDLKICNLLTLVGHEFRLHQLHGPMIKTWYLLYEISKKTNSISDVITSISFIIEHSKINEEIKSLQQKAEVMLLSIDKTDEQQLNIYVTYYLNKSIGYFKNKLYNQAFSTLMLIKDYVKKDSLKVAKSRFTYLICRFLLLPCKMKLINHNLNLLLEANTSLTTIAMEYSKHTVRCSYLSSLLLEISLFNGWLYYTLRLPREIRSYTKESLILAQKLVLPIKTGQFLSLLAFTDLLDKKYSDCKVKVNGLTKMLCYGDIPIVENMSRTFLEVATDNILNGSPNLREKPFHEPEIASHSIDCLCFKCTSSEYQLLIFDSIHIKALMHLYQYENYPSTEYFLGGQNFYGILEKKSIFQYIDVKNVSKIGSFKNCSFRSIEKTYCTFLLNLSNLLIVNKDFDYANNIIVYIKNTLKNIKCEDTYIWDQILLQSFNIFTLEDKHKKMLEGEKNIFNDLTLVVKHKPLKIPMLDDISTKFPQHVKKKITFNVSSDSDSDSDSKKTKSPKERHFTLPTPAKTPAAKFKIYTPKTLEVVTTLETNDNKKENSRLFKNPVNQRNKMLMEKLKAEQQQFNKEKQRSKKIASIVSTKVGKSKIKSRRSIQKVDSVSDSMEIHDKLDLDNKADSDKYQIENDHNDVKQVKNVLSNLPVDDNKPTRKLRSHKKKLNIE